MLRAEDLFTRGRLIGAGVLFRLELLMTFDTTVAWVSFRPLDRGRRD